MIAFNISARIIQHKMDKHFLVYDMSINITTHYLMYKGFRIHIFSCTFAVYQHQVFLSYQFRY